MNAAQRGAWFRIIATIIWSLLPIPSWNDLREIAEDWRIIKLGCEHTRGHFCTCSAWLSREHEPDCPERCPIFRGGRP